MRHLRKVMTLVVAALMALVVATPAWAANDGQITLTNATKGQTYEAYLVFTASPSNADDISKGVSYTATASQIAVDGFDDIFDTYVDAEGNYTVSKKTGVTDDEVIAFVKENIDDLKQGDAISGTYSDDSTVVFSGLEYGYYYISSSLGTVVTIDTAAKAATVVDKNVSNPEKPEKVITDEDSAINESQDQTGLSAVENNASVGSVESFEVTFNAVNWVQDAEENKAGTGTDDKVKVTEYNFIDTPIGLDIDSTTVKVTVNGDDVTSTIDDIAVDANGVLTFTIPWVDDDGKSLYEAKESGNPLIPVVITYDAKVNSTAATRTAPNEVEVKYNNETSVGTDKATTYTYKFDLLKTDENDNPLVGAEFELYYGEAANESATALTFTKVSDGLYRFDPNGTVTNIAPVGDGAKATVIGLDDAKYMLREVVVPTGYNKIPDTPVAAVTKETNDTDEASTVEANQTTVKNQKGSVLPSTGGMGTTILYIVGGIMVAGAAIYLLTKKRASNM